MVSASTRSPPTYVPAFACRISSWPACSRTRGSTVAQSFGSSRSMSSGITASPCLSRSAFSAASSRSTITTRAPAASIASVLANPMPDAAPVTAATLPSNSLAMGSPSCRGHWDREYSDPGRNCREEMVGAALAPHFPLRHRPYRSVIASPLRSAFAIRPTCVPDSSSTAPFWLVSTIARAPRPTAMPAPAAP
ncbi:hypothetical protein ACVWXM_005885 [Bradyrhizobium sp. GM7.3]